MEVFTRRAFTKHGITIYVEIDFNRGKVSLVEDRFGGGPKKWIFSEREKEYLNGWMAILDSMNYAVGEAKKMLEAYDQDKLEKAVRTYVELDSFDKKGKKKS